MTVIYRTAHAWITDMGREVKARDAATGQHVMTISRYGVWSDRSGRAQVILVTDDLDEAKRKADAV